MNGGLFQDTQSDYIAFRGPGSSPWPWFQADRHGIIASHLPGKRQTRRLIHQIQQTNAGSTGDLFSGEMQQPPLIDLRALRLWESVEHQHGEMLLRQIEHLTPDALGRTGAGDWIGQDP